MKKRGGGSNLLSFLLLGAILISVWLAMFQVDRQWAYIRDAQQKLDAQTRDIAEIRRRLNQGLVAAAPAESAVPEGDQRGFARAARATASDDYARGDWMVQLFGDTPQRLTPTISTDSYAVDVQQLVLDTLLTRDPETLEWLPLVPGRRWGGCVT